MSVFIAGMVVFFGLHLVSVLAPDWRDKMAQRFGVALWQSLYGVASVVGWYLLAVGYGEARLVSSFLYSPPVWFSHIAGLLMVPVFILAAAAVLPGWISRKTRYPMLFAVKLWALSHLLVNGRWVEVVMFGAFLLWAGLVRMSLKRRPPRRIFALPENKLNDLFAVVIGLGIYGAFVMHLHQSLIGVAPFGS